MRVDSYLNALRRVYRAYRWTVSKSGCRFRFIIGYGRFSGMDAHSVHRAMIEAEHQAREREDKMPTSASALLTLAAQLYAVREKILDRLPPEERRIYPRGASNANRSYKLGIGLMAG